MRYLTAAEILTIHDRVIEETRGLFGVRDEHLLKSLAQRPRASFGGAEQFKRIFEKSAALLEAIATYHVFLDGNKRTAISAASIFLNANGFAIDLPVEETEQFMLAVAQKQKTIAQIAEWIEARGSAI
ncbi:MAG TPA: type II toxin-antitoxin system death-on-curing family toxin [Candidatus Paceibacterota bacterium]|nr:type II toxin-antitoxin system death-on-curing family toxin [Candidatus Paceibacterota bacterium]